MRLQDVRPFKLSTNYIETCQSLPPPTTAEIGNWVEVGGREAWCAYVANFSSTKGVIFCSWGGGGVKRSKHWKLLKQKNPKPTLLAEHTRVKNNKTKPKQVASVRGGRTKSTSFVWNIWEIENKTKHMRYWKQHNSICRMCTFKRNQKVVASKPFSQSFLFRYHKPIPSPQIDWKSRQTIDKHPFHWHFQTFEKLLSLLMHTPLTVCEN